MGRSSEPVDLLIFTTVGRSEYLARTLGCLRSLATASQFTRVVVACDGFDPKILALPAVAEADQVVMTPQQRGYFSNIRQGLRVVESEVFFWCEDDWEFTALPPAAQAREAFGRYPRLAQVRIPKQQTLLLEDKRLGRLMPGIWGQDLYYSLNPHYARSELLRSALGDGLARAGAGQNVEVALLRWLRSRGHVFGVWDPAVARAVHIGRHPTGYAAHQIPVDAAYHVAVSANRAVRRTAPQTGVTIKARPPGPREDGILQAGRTAVELTLKGLYAAWAIVTALLLLPISRQCRAFIRTIWSYWHPDYTMPTGVGPTKDDAAPSAGR